MKKFLMSVFLNVYIFAYCCPLPCNSEINKAYNTVYKEIEKSYKNNIKKLNELNDNYQQAVIKENNSTKLLSEYLNRLKIEYIQTKKEIFNIKNIMKLKGLK